MSRSNDDFQSLQCSAKHDFSLLKLVLFEQDTDHRSNSPQSLDVVIPLDCLLSRARAYMLCALLRLPSLSYTFAKIVECVQFQFIVLGKEFFRDPQC